MITIEQLLESVDLDFEPRFVTKDEGGWLAIWEEKPHCCSSSGMWQNDESCFLNCGYIKLAEFDGKDWTECIYEVPRKTTGKIEKLERHIEMDNDSARSCPPSGEEFMYKINQLIDAVNKHADIIQQIGDWGTRKGECLWCEKITSVNLGEMECSLL